MLSFPVLPAGVPAAGFSGSRSLPSSFLGLVRSVVASCCSNKRVPVVGCASGLDQLVRSCGRSVVFSAAGQQPFQLVARSSALVRAVAGAGRGSLFVGFPSGSCPSGVVPCSSWPSGGGSGSWASLALAAGLGLPVVVFPVCGAVGSSGRLAFRSPAPSFAPPASWGRWVRLSAGVWCGSFLLLPSGRSAGQLALL